MMPSTRTRANNNESGNGNIAPPMPSQTSWSIPAKKSSSTNRLKTSGDDSSNTTKQSEILDHPYLCKTSSSSSVVPCQRRRLTRSNILLAERRVLRDLKRRSGWKLYSRGPSNCCTQIKDQDEDDSDDHSRSPTNSDTDDDSDHRRLHRGRVDSLSLNDLTVYALLEVLDTYLRNSTRRDVPRPAIPPTPPPWTMPDDIAVLDQLHSMELFQCTDMLPASMNYLIRLRSLKLRSCHGLRMSNLSFQLRELEVTDSEGVTPSTFANLPQLERIKLYRVASSATNTRNVGRDWIQELQQTNLAWENSLKDLCFCATGLTNEDVASLLVDSLCNKFPHLRSIFIISNPQFTSFQPILRRWEERHGDSTANSFQRVPPSLKVLSLTGTGITKTVDEMRAIQKFLQMYNEIGLFMIGTLPTALRTDVVKGVNLINHQLTLNRAGGPAFLSCLEKDNHLSQDGASSEPDRRPRTNVPSLVSFPQQRRPLPMSMWPIVLERAMNLDYVPCYDSTADRNSTQNLGRLTGRMFQEGNDVAQRADRIVNRARAVLHRQLGANENNENDPDGNAVVNPNPQHAEEVANENDSSEDEIALDENWMEEPQAFSDRSRHDAVYYLLRNGPVLLTTDKREPHCRRRRSFIGRKCKRIKFS